MLKIKVIEELQNIVQFTLYVLFNAICNHIKPNVPWSNSSFME